VLHGVGHQLVADDSDADRLAAIEGCVFGVHSDCNRPHVSERRAQPPANSLKILLRVYRLIARRKLEMILTLRNDVQPPDRALRGLHGRAGSTEESIAKSFFTR
jgi:hypothetical protein